MDKDWKRSVLTGIAGLGAIAILYMGISNYEPSAHRLEQSRLELVLESPDIADKMKAIQAVTDVVLTSGTLEGTTLAATTISIDGSDATIIVDVDKVEKTHDRLEPVIGHELYHVWEAYYVYGGPDKFCNLVTSEKPIKQWYDRTYERSAILRENQLRSFLKAKFPSKYGK